jgi:hypothetical protein
MAFLVHLQCSAVVAIVNCPERAQFIEFRSLKQAALQSIWLFQESPNIQVAVETNGALGMRRFRGQLEASRVPPAMGIASDVILEASGPSPLPFIGEE